MTLSVGKELENQLVEAANRLLSPPSAAEELVNLLDQVETYLTRVEQSPSESMQTALDPLKKALVTNNLLRHGDMDVKVAAASCISEITRITAPNAPYGDDQMKDIFQLIVSTFDGLFDMSSRSYSKRVTILETVAKVRSCVVMLDLECDVLILEMFQHFLKAIRDNHPGSVFSSMETIMTLVLEESEDVSSGLISLLLTCAKKENKDVLPVARKLAEKVLVKCAAKLKPYMMQAVPSLGLSMSDYSETVASICQETSSTVDQNNVNAFEEQMADVDKDKLLEMGSDETPQAAAEMMPETTSREHTLGVDMLQTSLMSNVSVENGDDGVRKSPNSSMNTLEKSECPQSMKTERYNSVTKLVTPETNLDQPVENTKGKTDSTDKVCSLTDSHVDSVKEAVELPAQRKAHHEKANNTKSEDQLGNEAKTSITNEKRTGPTGPLSASTASKSKAISSGLTGQSLPDGVHPKRGRPKKGSIKQGLLSGLPLVEGTLSSKRVGDVVPPSSNISSKEQPKGKHDSKAKPHTQTDKKEGTKKNKGDTPPSGKVVIEKKFGKVGALEENPVKKSGQKSANGDELPAEKDESKTKWVGGNTIVKKDVAGEPSDKKKVSSLDSATRSSDKDQSHLDETPKTNSKRKRTLETKETSSNGELLKEFDERVVSSKIKVWWPLDQRFYEGVVASYDPVTKKHKVSYNDGDVETLNLRMERWEFVGSDPILDEVQSSDLPSARTSETRQGKIVKTDSDSSPERAKSNASLRRGKGGSTGKGKSRGAAASRSGGSSRLDGKIGAKSRDDTTKISNKTKDESRGKSEDVRPKTKDNRKPIKLKDGTPKSSIKPKGETSVSGSKSSPNDINLKGKSSALKVQESEKMKFDSMKAVENETKSRKKRRRLVKG